MQSTPRKCDYYFAPQSPYTYLGHRRFAAIVKEHGLQVNIKPIDLHKVFNVSGGIALAKRSMQRQVYRLEELKRWSDFLNLPLRLQPKYFPVNGDAAAKYIIATEEMIGQDAAIDIAEEIMRSVWVHDIDIANTDSLIGLANTLGHDGLAILNLSVTVEVQGKYDLYTDEAIRANVFGSPWYIIDGANYWGQDRMDFIERDLKRFRDAS
jgi:2-hydroxychromene-2-carboxylate isomerase